MVEIKVLEKETAGVIGKVLRDNFGKGPGNVVCSLSDSVLVAFITNFASPVELSLMNIQQNLFVEKTRDLLMSTLKEEMKTFMALKMRYEVKEFYYDWNLESHSGMLIFIFNKEAVQDGTYPEQDQLHGIISEISHKAEKVPDEIQSKKLTPKHLLVTRDGILVSIEKELISLGFEETLLLAKRRLEKRLIEEHMDVIEQKLGAKVMDFFIAWNFTEDKSYILFVLQQNAKAK
ncbi:Na-translocating system protein MpsC family protein [Fictibacillus iocasae]|uniref:Na-translocating system protein MpsC family protein n=1 Tax=Fictibacillus iocasae TaxID=2715437 RepID=A0ABW2NS77_9BACL